MAAPKFVPTPSFADARVYTSPPSRDGSWMADRPGDIVGVQPVDDQLGNQGPDQGYALKLAAELGDELVLQKGEHKVDVLAGGVGVALKRASIYGRAPVMHDLRVGLGIFGFFETSPDAELVEFRRDAFEEVHHPHMYSKLRALVDSVSAETLKAPHQSILDKASKDWRSAIDVS